MRDQYALHDIRVIDFGQYIAGPMAAMLLADQGADVIRVDPPDGPHWKTPANATWNRNKRSIALDLKKQEDRAIAHKLINSADVVIENFRPGVMARLGLGASVMMQTNPRLIYCSLPGFGHDDPRAQVRAWEGVLGAATGAYRTKSGGNGSPIYTVIPYASVFGAFLCAVSVAMALTVREHSGAGQRVEIPLFDAAFSAIGERGLLVNGARVAGAAFEWSRALLCANDRWLHYNANNKGAETFLEETGIARWRDAGFTPQELGQRFAAVMRTRTTQEWEDFCAGIGTEAITCHTSAEWLAHPQALASGIIADFIDPELGPFRGPGINVRLSATPGAVRTARPQLDAQREEILKDLSPRCTFNTAPGKALPHGPLHGIKVLDLCVILAGPACGRTLAEFGADVIKIDSPHTAKIQRHVDINRGKRSILLDLKTAEGLKIFWRLVDEADVVLQNFRSGVAEKLGIGYTQVCARRPDIVYCSLNTYGQNGPLAARPGHERLAQAITGMMVRYGNDQPLPGPFPANDYGTGFMGCYAIVLALMHKRRTGQGQFVDTALAYTATMLQSTLLHDYAGKRWDEVRGQNALGTSPLDRAYEAADGWLFLAAKAGDLERCSDLCDLAALNSIDLAQALEQRIRQRSVDAWTNLLLAADIGAHRVITHIVDLMIDPLVRQRRLSMTREHAGIGAVTSTFSSIRMSQTPPQPGTVAAKPGADAGSVLSDIGLSAELDRLIDARVIVVDGVAAGC